MLTPEAIRAFEGEMTPKFLATSDGVMPNVVPIISLTAPDPSTLVFGEFMIWKTRRNLEVCQAVSALVLTEDLEVWSVGGRFVGFQERGPHLDLLNEKRMFRYNAYLGVRRAGVIAVERVMLHARLSRVGLLAQVAAVRALAVGRGRSGLPAMVAEKLGRLKAVRVVSALDKGGHPGVWPAMSLAPVGGANLAFVLGQAPALAKGASVAASVITFDPVAYQVKGCWQGERRSLGQDVGLLGVTEAYSACPPRPGERIL